MKLLSRLALTCTLMLTFASCAHKNHHHGCHKNKEACSSEKKQCSLKKGEDCRKCDHKKKEEKKS